jgi:hypothetical protein
MKIKLSTNRLKRRRQIFHRDIPFRNIQQKAELVTPYRLTLWSRVLLGKLTCSHLVKKFPAFYTTRRFITAFTSSRHLSLTWARSIQSMPPIPLPEDQSKYHHPIYVWFFQVLSVSQVSLQKPCTHLSSSPYVLHAPSISFFSIWSPESY